MALRTNVYDNIDLDAALGATLADNDDLKLNQFHTEYTINTSKPSIDLHSILCDRGWTGNFSANALNVECNQTGATTIIRFGGDRFALRSNSGAGTHRDILWDPVKSSAIFDLQETIAPKIRAQRGTLFMADSVTPTNIYLGVEARAYLYGISHLATLIDVAGNAFCETEKGFTDARIGGGGRLKINGLTCAVGDIDIGSGTLELKRCSAFGDLVARGGVIDASQLETDVTVTDGEIGRDVTILLPTGGAEFDYSACDLVGGGPKIVRN